MKTFLALILAAGLLSSQLLAKSPKLPISKAISIAENALKSRQLEGTLFISSVSLERASFTSPEQYWVVKWDHTIPAQNPRNREVGMKIRMDGTSVRLVKEPGAL